MSIRNTEQNLTALNNAVSKIIRKGNPVCILCDKAAYVDIIRATYPNYCYTPFSVMDVEHLPELIIKPGNVVVTTNPLVLDLFNYKSVIHVHENYSDELQFAFIKGSLINNMCNEGVSLSSLWLSSYFNEENQQLIY